MRDEKEGQSSKRQVEGCCFSGGGLGKKRKVAEVISTY